MAANGSSLIFIYILLRVCFCSAGHLILFLRRAMERDTHHPHKLDHTLSLPVAGASALPRPHIKIKTLCGTKRDDSCLMLIVRLGTSARLELGCA